ncbi:luciferin 4-monooxygenase-like [Anticarsia gemmatalis]|uniref:luciferin 4-monooxygenase-like n=1 Tax=Anticarsia gemmatalis TaxID=129554 RepID=UPI003F7600D8
MIVNNVVTSGPALTVPGHLSFGQYVIDKLRENSENEHNIALINGDTGHKVTTRHILQETVNVATGLQRLGVRRGDVVALCSENRDEYIPAALAVICCGATVTTLNVLYTKEEMTHVLNISRPKMIFASEIGLKRNLQIIKSASSIQKIIQFNGQPIESGVIDYKSVGVKVNPYEYEPVDVQGWTDVVFILYSSGTTGLPKGVMLTHVNVLYSAASFEHESNPVNNVLLTIVPWYHAYGLMSTINYVMIKKKLVYLSGFNPLKYLGCIQEYKVTSLAAVPPIVVFLGKAPIVEKFDLSSITVVWCGAAPLSSETIDQARKRMPNCKGIFQAYGMTETSLAATQDIDDENVPRKPGSGGYPLRGVKAKAIDIETRKKLGPNENGEICLKGPIIMKGYMGNEAATRDMFDEEGYMKTGDIGYYDKEGCFFIVDRLKELIKYKGSQINGDTGHKVTTRHILQETVNVATGLQRLGVRRGDVVALCSENRDEYIPAALAVICCGATVTTLNVLYTKEEMTHVLNISRPTLMLASEIGLKRNIATIKSAPSIKKIIQFNGQPIESGVIDYKSVGVKVNPYEYEPVDVQGWTDVVFILYSSGTTGLPKGVMLTHLNALYSAASFEKENIASESRLLTIMPWYHAYGLMSTINYIMINNLLVYLTGFNPAKYLGCIQEYKVTSLVAVPPIVVFLGKAPVVEKFDLSSITVVWCGAAPLSSETIDQARKRMPNCKGIFQAYGMTETSLAATKDVDDGTVPFKPGSAGYPLLGVKAKVVNIDTRKRLGPNENGEICLRGPNVMKGYAGDEAATRDILDEEGYLKTGDIGYYDKDGCFFIVDRLKELIKYKGSQVAPAAVESVVLQHSGVAECGVVGAPDELAGELPVAFVVKKPGVTLTEKELLDFTAARLSSASRLHGGVIFVDEIPKNPSGKVLRRALKEKLLQRNKSKL